MNNHNLTQFDSNENGPTLQTRIGFASAWITIAVAGILGNSLVIFIAIRFQKMNNVTNCFIVNLAVTDIVFLAFCMPFLVVQYTLDNWLFNQTFCKLLNFISFISVLVTVLTLVAMTIDRYIYVVRPFENLKWRKPKTVFLLSLIIWLTSCTLASPFYTHYGVTNIHDNYQQCVLLNDEALQMYFRIYTVTLYYFIPLTIIIISYAKLLYFVYSKENKLQRKTPHNIVQWSKKRRAVTKMVAIVTLAFSLCWLPITLFIISANMFKTKSIFLYYYKIIANSFAYLNSAINPILYAFLNRSFRNNCGSIFSKRSMSVFCGDEHRPTNENYQQKSTLPSTQIDRFSYQSTNHQSESSFRTNKKKHLFQMNNNIRSNNDFSDEDVEIADSECIRSMSTEKFRNRNQSNGSVTQTTSL